MEMLSLWYFFLFVEVMKLVKTNRNEFNVGLSC
jgi:hypothetical protein